MKDIILPNICFSIVFIFFFYWIRIISSIRKFWLQLHSQPYLKLWIMETFTVSLFEIFHSIREDICGIFYAALSGTELSQAERWVEQRRVHFSAARDSKYVQVSTCNRIYWNFNGAHLFWALSGTGLTLTLSTVFLMLEFLFYF